MGRNSANFNAIENLVYLVNPTGKPWFESYVFGYEILIINGLLAATGYGILHWIQSKKKS
jgi:RsiW-degrading membrane proteinase PrsW (M82 family)